jgi:hypothetical protein
VVLFNDKENLALEMQEMKEDIVDRLLQYVAAGGTNYSSGLKLAGRDPLRFVNSAGRLEPRDVYNVVRESQLMDMTGLKLLALNRIKISTIISTVDDLNYPEKTETYYIVNAPYVFLPVGRLRSPCCKKGLGEKYRCCKVVVGKSY